MRSYLVDHARRKIVRAKHRHYISLTETATASNEDSELVLAVAEALDRLEAHLPRAAQVVEMRWFAGLEYHEIAQMMRVSVRTVGSDWSLARAWLRSELALQACG